jgi:hypothetical protein
VGICYGAPVRSRAGRWVAAGALLLGGIALWAAHRSGPSSSIETVGPETPEGADPTSPVVRGLAYLARYPIEEVGMEYTKTTYPFALAYPDAPDLGNHFVAASLIEAYLAAGRADEARRIGGYLARQQEQTGIVPFDGHRYSLDADTTLVVLIALHAVGALGLEQAHPTFDTLEEHHRVGCHYRSHRKSNVAHSVADPHPEIGYNVLYLRSALPGLPGPEPACIAEAALMSQESDGVFSSYWYPGRLHVHHHALRGLHHHAGASGGSEPVMQAIDSGIEYLLRAQGSGGGWGEPSNAFDTANALLALRTVGRHRADPKALDTAMARAKDFLVRTQLADGSWPGVRIFYWYYPQCPDKTCPEEWHDRDRRILSTAAAVQALATLG